MNDDDLLRFELKRAAAAHEPDRTVMLNRIAANRSRPAQRRAPRVLASALAVAVILGIGGVARWALAGEESTPTPPVQQPPVVISSPSFSPSPSVSASPSSLSPSPSPSPSKSRKSPAAPTSASVVRGHPGDTQAEKGTLWSDGSIDPASTDTTGQSDVTLKASADLTSLDLRIRVTLTDGLTSTGTVTVDGVTASVIVEQDALVYEFVLQDGKTLKAGTYLFAGAYKHAAGGRDAGQDTYEAIADDALHKRPHVYGNFFPAGK